MKRSKVMNVFQMQSKPYDNQGDGKHCLSTSTYSSQRALHLSKGCHLIQFLFTVLTKAVAICKSKLSEAREGWKEGFLCNISNPTVYIQWHPDLLPV